MLLINRSDKTFQNIFLVRNNFIFSLYATFSVLNSGDTLQQAPVRFGPTSDVPKYASQNPTRKGVSISSIFG